MADPHALPFDLFVQALPTGSYRVTVTNAPSGPASVEIGAPFSFIDLARLSDVLEGRAGLSAADQAARAQEFGQKLFQDVISGQVAEAYANSQNAAGSVGLNIRLQLDQAGLLRGVPWELIRDPAGGKLTVTVPKSTNITRSVGGAREVLLRPGIVIPAMLILVLLIGLIGVGISALASAHTSVDLVVTKLRFFPSKPDPGQLTTVTLEIHNQGTTDSGPFSWYWYEDKNNQNQGQPPDKSGPISGLPAGTSITVRSDVVFGWWGLYSTEAWVNPLNELKETNTFNNFNTGDVTTSDRPFVIDWTIKPDSSVITAVQDLKGDEFNDWGVIIQPQVTNLTNPDPTCGQAVPKIRVSTDADGNQVNQLVTGLPSSGNRPTQNPPACDSIPLMFKITHGIGSVAIDFTSARGGTYSLAVTDQNGAQLGSASKTVTANTQAVLTVPASGTLSKASAVQILFSGPGGMQINTMTLTKSVNP